MRALSPALALSSHYHLFLQINPSMIGAMKFLSKLKRLFDPMDLTKGPIAKSILLFAIPIILSLLFQQIYVFTDVTIVGKTLS